jgi:BlaI family transcriptional regulator, penicillinase repressor
MDLRSLTRGEAEVMKTLWRLKKAFIRDILANMQEPRPAYTTVATFLKILEKKQIVAHVAYGNMYEYYPLIAEEEYQRHEITQLIENYFDNSAKSLVSFFLEDKMIRESDLDELEEFINRNKKR